MVKRPGRRVGAIQRFDAAIAAAASAYASADYNREYVIDLPQLHAFVQATQEPLVAAFNLDEDGPVRQKFLARLQGESPSAASLTFCAAASSMVRTISTSSMARLRRVIQRPPRVSLRTGSASPASSNTAATRHSSRSILAYSSTACPSPPSS
jgi:hypothetical protein